MGDLIFEIVVSVGLLTLGISSIVRKQTTIRFGRGRSIVIGKLSASRAILFGCVSLLAGLIPIAIMLYNYAAPNNAIEQGTLDFIIGLGLTITFIVLLLELFIEFLVALQNSARKKD